MMMNMNEFFNFTLQKMKEDLLKIIEYNLFICER